MTESRDELLARVDLLPSEAMKVALRAQGNELIRRTLGHFERANERGKAQIVSFFETGGPAEVERMRKWIKNPDN